VSRSGARPEVSCPVAVIIAKQALDNTPALDATFVRMLAGAVGVGIWALATGQLTSGLAPLRDAQFLWKLIGAVAVVTFGGFWLSLVAIKYTSVAIANTLNSLEPVFILPLAAFILRERITLSLVLCALATVFGVGLLSIQP
jgi:drug/metabolite transporter (DMT)-like permease